MAASQAEPQMDPAIADLHAILAKALVGRSDFYFIEVRLLAGRFDTLTKQHLIRDFTKIIMLAEGKTHFSEDANRVWVHIVELQIEDWGIGGHTDWLRDYESALNVLGTELQAKWACVLLFTFILTGGHMPKSKEPSVSSSGPTVHLEFLDGGIIAVLTLDDFNRVGRRVLR